MKNPAGPRFTSQRQVRNLLRIPVSLHIDLRRWTEQSGGQLNLLTATLSFKGEI